MCGLCDHYDVSIVHYIGGDGSYSSQATEPDVKKDPDVVEQYRNDVLQALRAEFNLPYKEYKETDETDEDD